MKKSLVVLVTLLVLFALQRKSVAQENGLFERSGLEVQGLLVSDLYQKEVGNGLFKAYTQGKETHLGEPRLRLANPFRDEFVYGPFREEENPDLWKLDFKQLGNVKLEVWVASDHRHKGNKKLNEKNPGLGGRYFFDERNFAVGAYIRENSQKEPAWFAGWGQREVLLQESGFKLYGGGAIVLMHYGLRNSGHRVVNGPGEVVRDEFRPESADGPMGVLGLELNGYGLSLNANYIPIADVTVFSLTFQKLF